MNRSPSPRFTQWLRSLVHRDRFEAEMQEEIGFHLQARAEELMEQGLPAEEARRQARVEFGGVETHRDGMRAAFGLRWWDDLVADLRYAVRLLRQSPSFTLVAIASLALAIGANTTIFSLANELMFKQLGVPRAGELRLFMLRGPAPLIAHSSWGDNSIENGMEVLDMFTYPTYLALRAGNSTLGPIAAFKDFGRANITAHGEAASGTVQLVSGEFSSVMEIKPQLGRALLPSDDTVSETSNAAVISDGFWKRSFGGSTAVLGQTISVNGLLLTVVGVNPKGFTGAAKAQASPDVFLPLAMIDRLSPSIVKDTPTESQTLWWVNLIARMRPGVSEQKAAANINTVFQAAVRTIPGRQKKDHVPTVLLEDGSKGLNLYQRYNAKPIYVLLGLAGLVLLLACANLANLMLARATAREREMSVRLALGAGRERLVRQVLTESLLLSVVGGMLGLVLGFVGRDLIPHLMEVAWQGDQTHVEFDGRVFLFAAAITVATGLLFGIWPAWRASRSELNGNLKEMSRSASRRRTLWAGKLIVAFQIALSTLLVAASALFLRTVINLNHVQPGFRTEGLLEFDLGVAAKRYPGRRSVELLERVQERLEAVPGVLGVSYAEPTLLAGSQWNNDFDVEGAPKSTVPEADKEYPYLSSVGERYLPLMNIRILRGRNFGSQDTATSPKVSIINQAIARKFFPHSDPIGRRFRMSGGIDGKTDVYKTIIGVAADTLYSDVRRPVQLLHFDLFRQNEDAYSGTMVLRTDVDAKELVPELRHAVQDVDPDLPITNVRTMREQIDGSMQDERMFASLSAGFGVMALLLACVGIYGVMAYTVAQRTQEIGIRLALGAPRRQVRGQILREAGLLAAMGVVTGSVAVLALVQVVKSLLYGLQPRDPVSLTAAGLLLLAVALVAGWVPAARASRVEPMVALRHE